MTGGAGKATNTEMRPDAELGGESFSHPRHTKDGPENIKSKNKKHFIQRNIHWKVSEQVSMARLAHEEDCAGAVVAPVMTQARYNLCK